MLNKVKFVLTTSNVPQYLEKLEQTVYTLEHRRRRPKHVICLSRVTPSHRFSGTVEERLTLSVEISFSVGVEFRRSPDRKRGKASRRRMRLMLV